uniref:Uncharacterized protein n=1 Tax=Romanomermis culicivorax TaxID=13658 RepID=A0A915L2J3_ROMCU
MSPNGPKLRILGLNLQRPFIKALNCLEPLIVQENSFSDEATKKQIPKMKVSKDKSKEPTQILICPISWYNDHFSSRVPY